MVEKILYVIGSISEDIIFKVNKLPSSNEEAFPNEMVLCDGGGGANVASFITSLFNIKTILLSCIGDDVVGKRLISKLTQVGVDTSFIREIKDKPSTRHIIVSDESESRITFVFSGVMSEFSIKYYSNLFTNKELNIYLAPVRPDTAFDLLSALKISQHRLFINPGSALFSEKDYFLKMISSVYCLILNKTEAFYYSDCQDIFEAAKFFISKGVKVLSITLGMEGSLTFFENQYMYEPAFKVEVISPIGCGDAYAGAFAGAVLSEYSIKDATKLGNTLGAIISMQKGIRDFLPSIAELKSFREKTPLRKFDNYLKSIFFKRIDP